MSGVLCDVKIVEFAGIGPAPFCGMLLADMGAEVIRIDRTSTVGNDPMEPRFNPMLRGRQNIALDLKQAQGRAIALDLCASADVLIEGFRPGVMERLGLGPDSVHERNSALVYGRMTGWGQDGPLAQAPGHDLNYIALTGALHAIGKKDSGPVPPLVLAGDFGGGGLYLALGVLGAYIEAQRTGQGRVVDAAVVDGAASLMTAFYGMLAQGSYIEQRESNRLDGGSHFYNVYETADGEYISLAPTELQFFNRLMAELDLDPADFDQNDREHWPLYREKLAGLFKTRTRDEWCDLLEDRQVCFAPVLKMSEAPQHPHNQARQTFMTVDGVEQPARAPRFSESFPEDIRPPSAAGADTRAVLSTLGYTDDTIRELLEQGIAAQL